MEHRLAVTRFDSAYNGPVRAPTSEALASKPVHALLMELGAIDTLIPARATSL